MGMFPLGKGTAGTATTILLPTGIILQLLTVKNHPLLYSNVKNKYPLVI
jgi:hypothetical protein